MRLHTRFSLATELNQLGIEAGDTVFIHSSYKSVGNVEGGAAGIVSAIEDAVGSDGLILMPSFNLVDYDDRAGSWNIATTQSGS